MISEAPQTYDAPGPDAWAKMWADLDRSDAAGPTAVATTSTSSPTATKHLDVCSKAASWQWPVPEIDTLAASTAAPSPALTFVASEPSSPWPAWAASPAPAPRCATTTEVRRMPAFELPQAYGENRLSKDFVISCLDEWESEDLSRSGSATPSESSESEENTSAPTFHSLHIESTSSEWSEDEEGEEVAAPAAASPHSEGGARPRSQDAKAMQFWLWMSLGCPLVAGHAETGERAQANAPRPSITSSMPLAIRMGPDGVVLEAAEGFPIDLWEEMEAKTAAKQRTFKRERGRSRSPTRCAACVPLNPLAPDMPRGRAACRLAST